MPVLIYLATRAVVEIIFIAGALVAAAVAHVHGWNAWVLVVVLAILLVGVSRTLRQLKKAAVTMLDVEIATIDAKIATRKGC